MFHFVSFYTAGDPEERTSWCPCSYTEFKERYWAFD